jgi:hypothetical protein
MISAIRDIIGRGGSAAAAVAVMALLAAAPAGVGTAHAQARPPAGPPVAPPGQPPSVEQSIAQLHQQLQITPAEEGAFQAFARVMRENAGAAEQLQAPGPNTSAVEGLRLSIRAMQQELAGMQRLLPALQTLYSRLSPQQRRTADRIFNQPPPG